jgi:anti-sigma factor RsiW
MPCEHYKDALIEAAASGAALANAPASDARMAALRAHLESCPSCRATFAQEQSLFAAIDSGLHNTANSEIPPSFLPRVRDGLDGVVASRLPWAKSLAFASASVALAFVIFLVVRLRHVPPDNVAKQAPAVLPARIMPEKNTSPGKIPAADVQTAAVRATHSRTASNSTNPHSVASSNPEVLVPPDEREAFARFVVELRGRGEVALALVTPAVQTKEEFPSIEPLQIKPLEKQQAESSDGAEPKF